MLFHLVTMNKPRLELTKRTGVVQSSGDWCSIRKRQKRQKMLTFWVFIKSKNETMKPWLKMIDKDDFNKIFEYRPISLLFRVKKSSLKIRSHRFPFWTYLFHFLLKSIHFQSFFIKKFLCIFFQYQFLMRILECLWNWLVWQSWAIISSLKFENHKIKINNTSFYR